VVTAAIRDITERKAAEAQIRKLNSQLEEALRRSDRLATTGRLAASIAHEINNPLEALTGALYLLGSEELTGDQLELVHTAQRELERLASITRLTLEPHREAKFPVDANAAELLDASVSTFASKIKRRRIEVVREYDADARLSVNPSDLRQVVTNLISNAIDVMSEGGILTLRVKRDRDVIHVSVADDGTGIHPENLVQIFEPFFSTKGEKGLGLGLWISRKIVEQMGGSLDVSSSISERNHGTCFTLTLPLERKPAGDETSKLEQNES
jgi:two-component system, NtrC family, sensor kinase